MKHGVTVQPHISVPAFLSLIYVAVENVGNEIVNHFEIELIDKCEERCNTVPATLSFRQRSQKKTRFQISEGNAPLPVIVLTSKLGLHERV